MAGETSVHCHDHQPGGGREDQVPALLAWDWESHFGPFEVTLTDEQMFADYTTRTLEAQVSNCYSMLLQFHM